MKDKSLYGPIARKTVSNNVCKVLKDYSTYCKKHNKIEIISVAYPPVQLPIGEILYDSKFVLKNCGAEILDIKDTYNSSIMEIVTVYIGETRYSIYPNSLDSQDVNLKHNEIVRKWLDNIGNNGGGSLHIKYMQSRDIERLNDKNDPCGYIRKSLSKYYKDISKILSKYTNDRKPYYVSILMDDEGIKVRVDFDN